jgi:hypothetical protein
MMHSKLMPFAWLAGTIAVAACHGDGGAPSGGGGTDIRRNVAAACANRDPGPSPVRRLTHFEYDNTIRDLLGDDSAPSSAFPPDETALGFNNNAEVLSVTDILAQAYLDAAEGIAGRAVANPTLMGQIAPCGGGDMTACGRSFIQTFGRRAWRRPLTQAESDRLAALFADAMSDGYPAAVQAVMEVMLQSPQFLYRVELGQPAAARPGWMKLTSWEIASRLSFLVWASGPDEALLDAAAADKLSTAADVQAQARRMLSDARAHAVLTDFHRQWLMLDQLAQVEKDQTIYPMWNRQLPQLMQTEVSAFVDSIMWNGDGKVSTLLTAPYTFANASLAAFYGLSGPQGDAFERVALDPAQRSGILTQGAFLVTEAKANQTSPVLRGKFVRQQLFCTPPPPPPPNLQIRPPSLDPRLTTRERFAEHAQNPFCASCHKLMDPIGLAFENFDGVGRWRDSEGGQPIDASGELIETDVDGTFVGPVALAQRLAISDDVQSCVVTQWFRYGYGRAEVPDADACSLATLNQAFTAAGGNVRELLVALTQTDAFMYRRAADGGTN